MAQRPVLTSLLGFAVAAGAVRVASGPPEPGYSRGDSGKGEHRQAASPQVRGTAETTSKLAQLRADAFAAGRAEAEENLRSKICSFPNAAACPPLQPEPSGKATATLQGNAWPVPEVMILIAPDPVHTHLALWFDRMIDGFEDAMQDSGWEYQGSWLPWSSSAAAPGDEGDFESQQQQEAFVAGRSRLPGVLLFRPADRRAQPKQPLVVFVVGDSPTVGVNASQFHEAAERFAELAVSAPAAPLRILGPDFTGSGPSLQSLLGKERNGVLSGRAVEIVSGTVSDWKCGHFLPSIAAADSGCEHSADHFTSFGAAANWEEAEVLRFLTDRGDLHPREIAYLTEDESGFGNLSPPPVVSDPKRPEPDRVLRLKFPRGISHLRSAYQKSSVWGFGASKGGAASSLSLTLDFGEVHEGSDSVATFAQQQTPVSQEGNMAQVAGMLQKYHIRVVLVTATDVLDKLFVAQILARMAPQTSVVVGGMDVLFLRENSRSSYQNMYAIGPWPLLPMSPGGLGLAQMVAPVRQFPDDITEGVYTAARYLVKERIDELPDYKSPFPPAETPDRPPLWVSSIGRGYYWPLAVLDGERPGESTNDPPIHQRWQPPRLDGDSPGRSERLLMLAAVLLTLLHAGKCWDLKALGTIATGYRTHDEASRQRKLLLQLGMSLLGAVMLSLAYPKPRVWGESEAPLRLLFCFAWMALGLSVGRICWGLLVGLQPRRRIGVAAAACLGFGVGGYLFWVGIWRWLPGTYGSGSGLDELLVFRAQHPFSGSSPVLPLLILLQALAWLLFTHMGQLTFSPDLRPRLPNDVHGISNCPSGRSVQPIAALLWPDEAEAKRERWMLFLATAVPVLAIWYVMYLGPQMLESRLLRVLTHVGMLLVTTGICWNLALGAVIWLRLKTLCLEPLESSPLRRGFTSICGLKWKNLWLTPSRPAQYRVLMRALEQADRHVMDDPANLELLPPMSLRAAEAQMWTAVNSRPPNMSDVVTKFGAVQERLALVAERLLAELKIAWAGEKERVTAVDATEKKEEGGKDGSVATGSEEERKQAVREEWVALIYVHYARLVLLQVRGRLATAGVMYVLLVWAVTSYPFLNRHALMVGLSSLLGVLTIVILTTYASINRDAILSRTTENAPGKLDSDFFVKTASLVGVPLLGFMASQFPEISSFLFSWIEPGMAVK